MKKKNAAIKIAPSILAADFMRLGEEIKAIEKAGAAMVHIDVMDGMFVPNISIGVPVVESLRKATELQLDVHLMIVEPIRYVETFARAGADVITVHLEACKDVGKTIEKIRELGCKAGVSIKPGTDADKITPWLEKLDMVLVMTVEPGFGGQKYIHEASGKIYELRRYIDEKGLDVDIQVDGGINMETIREAAAAGANIFVAGTAVFRTPDPGKTIRDLMLAAQEAMNKEV